MIEELIAAAAVGGSLGNAWACALLSLGCSIDSRRGGSAFIAGRFLGLLLLGSAIAALGLAGGLDPTYFLLAFGVMTIAFGVFVLLRILTRHHRHRHGNPLVRLLHRGRRRHGHGIAMPDGGDLDLEADSASKVAYVFLIGVVRGATPCAKMMVLAPLLVSVDFGLAIGMILVFAAASTVYPVIGFLSGGLLRQAERYALYLKVGAAVLLIVLGAYFFANAFATAHGGG